MKTLFLFILNVFFVFRPAFAQPSFVKSWDYRYGGNANDKLETFQQTSDGGFIMGGSSVSGMNGDKSEPSRGGMDYWVVKTNKNGIKEWDKRFGGSLSDELHSVIQTSDGGFLLGGNSRSGVSGDKSQPNWDTSVNPSTDFWIVKIDSLGNKQWDKRFGGIWADDLWSVKESTDGGFILGGFSTSGVTGDKSQPSWAAGPDYWVVKTDASGNKQWDKRFGGTKNDQLYSVVLTNDGGYLLGGFSWSDISGDKTQPKQGAVNYCDYWIVKIDAGGNKQWDKRYGGNLNDQLYYMINTNDGGYILAGYSWSDATGDKTMANFGPSHTSDYWIIKTDGLGNVQWDKSFGGNKREDEFGLISQTVDKGYLISGTSYSDISGNKTENNPSIEQSWIIKTDSLGNKKWDKTIFTNGHDESGMAVQIHDGSYVIANYTNGGIAGYKSQRNRDSSGISYDFWILKLVDPNLIPEAAFTSTEHVFCPGTCVDYSNLSLYADSYQWIFNGANPSASSDENPQGICYNTSGSYDVSLMATNSNGTDTFTFPDYVTIFPPVPTFSIVHSSDTLFAPQGFTNYQWYQYNTIINGATDYFLVTMQSGTFTVAITDSNGCTAGSSILIVNTGLNEAGIFSNDIEVFPNPAENYFTLSFKPDRTAYWRIQLFNSIGQEAYVNEKIFFAGENKIDVDSHDFPGGIYFLKITDGEKVMMKRVVIEK